MAGGKKNTPEQIVSLLRQRSKTRFFNDLQTRMDCQSVRKSCTTVELVD
jgi:hypothetical protein